MNNFIQKCLEIDPKKRFTWKDILAHPWLSSELKVYSISQNSIAENNSFFKES